MPGWTGLAGAVARRGLAIGLTLLAATTLAAIASLLLAVRGTADAGRWFLWSLLAIAAVTPPAAAAIHGWRRDRAWTGVGSEPRVAGAMALVFAITGIATLLVSAVQSWMTLTLPTSMTTILVSRTLTGTYVVLVPLGFVASARARRRWQDGGDGMPALPPSNDPDD